MQIRNFISALTLTYRFYTVSIGIMLEVVQYLKYRILYVAYLPTVSGVVCLSNSRKLSMMAVIGSYPDFEQHPALYW